MINLIYLAIIFVTLIATPRVTSAEKWINYGVTDGSEPGENAYAYYDKSRVRKSGNDQISVNEKWFLDRSKTELKFDKTFFCKSKQLVLTSVVVNGIQADRSSFPKLGKILNVEAKSTDAALLKILCK